MGVGLEGGVGSGRGEGGGGMGWKREEGGRTKEVGVEWERRGGRGKGVEWEMGEEGVGG